MLLSRKRWSSENIKIATTAMPEANTSDYDENFTFKITQFCWKRILLTCTKKVTEKCQSIEK